MKKDTRARSAATPQAEAANADTADVAVATPPKPRGRPRSFDRAAALDAAMEVFWEKGYEGASINDLTTAMGVNPPSLYAAFGDKENLFLETVQHYAASRGNAMCPQHPTARAAVESYLRYKVDMLSGGDHPKGCMLMVAFFTAANASSKLQKFLAMKTAESREMLKERIKRGIKEGDVAPDTDAEDLADFYMTIMAGLSQQARDGATERKMLATVERAMMVFPSTEKGSG